MVDKSARAGDSKSTLVSLPRRASFVFDVAHSTGSHPWLVPFADPEVEKHVSTSSFVSNIRMDGRVRAVRAESTVREVSRGNTGFADWSSSYRAFYRRRVVGVHSLSAPDRCAFLRAENGANLIGRNELSPTLTLVHVESLNAILLRFARARSGVVVSRLADELRRITRLPRLALEMPISAAAVDDWVMNLMAIVARGRRDILLDAVGALSDWQPSLRPPWWAALYDPLHDAITEGDAFRICTAVGLGHLVTPCCLIVWRYRVSDVGLLYCPTVLEAGDSPYHFPSPPGRRHGWSLSIVAGSSELVPEYVHSPLQGALVRTSCTRLLRLDRAVTPDEPSLRNVRGSHWTRLRSESRHRPDEIAWVDRHRGT